MILPCLLPHAGQVVHFHDNPLSLTVGQTDPDPFPAGEILRFDLSFARTGSKGSGPHAARSFVGAGVFFIRPEAGVRTLEVGR